MKKNLLFMGAALLFGFGAMAQKTVVMGWNQYATYPSSTYQQQETPSAFNGYEPQLDDTVIVRIAGTANEDIEDLKVVLIDVRPVVDYWAEFSEYISIGDIVKNQPFDTIVELVITKVAKGTTPLTAPKLVFDGDNEPLSRTGTIVGPDGKGEGGEGGGTSITLTLTTYEVVVKSLVVGPEPTPKIEMPYNQYATPKNYQIAMANQFPASWTPKIDDTVTFILKGTASHDITDFKVGIVDDRDVVDYWAMFCSNMAELGNVTAGASFELPVELIIDAITKDGTPLVNPKLVFMGLNDVLVLDGANTKITIELAEELDITIVGVETSSIAAVAATGTNVWTNASAVEISAEKVIGSVAIINMTGAQLVKQPVNEQTASISIAELPTGVYCAVITFADGTTQVVKFVK